MWVGVCVCGCGCGCVGVCVGVCGCGWVGVAVTHQYGKAELFSHVLQCSHVTPADVRDSGKPLPLRRRLHLLQC